MTVLSCLDARNFQQLRSLVPSYISLLNIPRFTRQDVVRVQPDSVILGSDKWEKDCSLITESMPYASKTLLWGNQNDPVSEVVPLLEMGYSYFPYPNGHEKLIDFLITHSPSNPDHAAPNYRDMGLQGESLSIMKIKHDINLYARTSASITLLGETGTGKEVCARALHKYSGRKGSFIAVNCAAIPESLLESELFGTVRGAYTDSISKIGYFEAAEEGTLFLDEIGELSIRMQAKLLRILEDKKVTRLGCTQGRTVDVRIICATSSNLFTMSEEGNFRKDLYYRLCILVIQIPPLRERRYDIPHLCRHLLTIDKSNKTIQTEAMTKLLSHSWPGNVRELYAILKRAAILSESSREIRKEHIQFL